MAFSRSTVVTLSSPFGPSSDKAGSKRIMHFVGLLWPLLTSRSAGRPNSAMPASPFQASGETSPGKNDDLPRTIAGSTPLPLGRKELRGQWSARPGPQRLVSGSCSSTHGFVSRFVQRTPHDERLALPFGPCDQVPGGLSPPSHRPCRAHHPTSRRRRVGARSAPPLRPTAPNSGPVYRRRVLRGSRGPRPVPRGHPSHGLRLGPATADRSPPHAPLLSPPRSARTPRHRRHAHLAGLRRVQHGAPRASAASIGSPAEGRASTGSLMPKEKLPQGEKPCGS